VTFAKELFFNPSKNYLFICTPLFESLKGRTRKSIFTWSEMEQQTAQSKKVLMKEPTFFALFALDL